MPLSGLTDREAEVVLRCLRAAVEGPFFPEWEFHVLIGLSRAEVAALAARWPNIDDTETQVQGAINNALNNLLGYPHNEPEAFRERVGESVQEVKRIFAKWRRACGLSADSGGAPQRGPG
jgi:hypothetical protein